MCRKHGSLDPSFDIEEDSDGGHFYGDEGHVHGGDDLIECDEPMTKESFSAVASASPNFNEGYEEEGDNLTEDRWEPSSTTFDT